MKRVKEAFRITDVPDPYINMKACPALTAVPTGRVVDTR